MELLNTKYFVSILFLPILFGAEAKAQTEVEPWGNLTGIRIDGQLMPFETSLTVIGKQGEITATGKEKQRPKYTREGNAQLITTNIDSLYFQENVLDAGTGKTTVSIRLTAKADTVLTGTYFTIRLPASFANGAVQLKLRLIEYLLYSASISN